MSHTTGMGDPTTGCRPRSAHRRRPVHQHRLRLERPSPRRSPAPISATVGASRVAGVQDAGARSRGGQPDQLGEVVDARPDGSGSRRRTRGPAARRPSRVRLTKYSSRGVRQCGPWIAPARSSVTGNRSPAARSSRSRATFRVLYVASPGGTVRCVSGIGTGYSGKPSGSPCVSKLRPLLVLVHRTAGDDDRRPDPAGEPGQLPAWPRPYATMSTRTSQPSPTAAASAAVVVPVQRDAARTSSRPAAVPAAAPRGGGHLPAVLGERPHGRPSDLPRRADHHSSSLASVRGDATVPAGQPGHIGRSRFRAQLRPSREPASAPRPSSAFTSAAYRSTYSCSERPRMAYMISSVMARRIAPSRPPARRSGRSRAACRSGS